MIFSYNQNLFDYTVMHYHFAKLSLHGPGARDNRHISLDMPPSPHVLVHSSMLMKLFSFPLQPPYTNSSHFSVSLLYPNLYGITKCVLC